MIYVLTGIAKAGKTFLSNEIRKRYSISVFSTDYIMMMLAKGNKNLGIDVYASDRSVARKIEPYVYGLIETMVQNNADYFFEGVHFNTDFSIKLKNEFKDNIRIVYIGYKNISVEDKVKELYIHKDVMDNPWLFDHQGEKLEDIVQYMIDESKRIYEECKELELDYIEITDIVKQQDEIILKLMNKVQ